MLSNGRVTLQPSGEFKIKKTKHDARAMTTTRPPRTMPSTHLSRLVIRLDRKKPNAPAQPRRAHVAADLTPHPTPAGGCSGWLGRTRLCRSPKVKARFISPLIL